LLASDDQDDGLGRLNFPFAREIVELVVFSSDEVFLQTLREAVGTARRIWHVPSADKVSDLLLAGQVGILVLDVQALAEDVGVFVEQIKRQFPDLVLVVAGSRDAENSLANLISAGAVYRFIHKPMSPGRARLFADAAVKKFEAQRIRTPPAPPRSGATLRRLAMAATGIVLAAGITAWALHQRARIEKTPSAAAAAAPVPEIYQPADDPHEAAAHPDVADARERLWAAAENALLEERLDDAPAAIDAARRAGVDAGRIALLTARLAKSRERQRSTPHPRSTEISNPVEGPAALEPAAVGPDEARRTGLLSLAEERIKEGRLIDPETDSALFYVHEAIGIDPDGNAVQAAKQTLAAALLAAARADLEHRDFDHCARLLAGADGIASAANVENARQLLDAARRQADADAREQILKAGRERSEEPPAVAAPPQNPLPDIVSAADLVRVKSVKAVYPAQAEAGQIEGWVELDFTVTETGEVKDIAVHGANPPRVFEAAAINALSQWRYKPVLKDGKPVALRSRIRIRFTLARRQS
jgi:TonB family protein